MGHVNHLCYAECLVLEGVPLQQPKPKQHNISAVVSLQEPQSQGVATVQSI